MAHLAFILPDLGGGGAERIALTLASDFAARGHAVDLVLLRATGRLLPLVPDGVRVIDLGARRFRSALVPLVHYLLRARPDAVQVSMWPLTAVGILAHRLARSRARLMVSDHVALSRQWGHSPLKMAVLRTTVRLLYPLADVRLLVSARAADDLAALSGLPRSALEVVYNPIRPPTPIAATPEAEVLWRAGEGVARIVSVGALKAQKNHALLIRAFARLRPGRPAKLMIVGEGPLLPELQAVATAEGVGEDVIFAGFAIDPWPYLASAELFVLSSDYEGFGNVLVEAMYAGLPVVSTDCESGPREILDEGRFGRLVPCGDADALAEAMALALDDPPVAEAMRARAEMLSGQAAIDRYLALMTAPPGELDPATGTS